jgi:branched-chain amino acid transport system ATP-binding protein
MLEIDGLSVRFDGIEALAGLTLAVPRGARVGVIGPNGSGKTTLLNAISGLVPLANGTITLDERTISHLPPREVARAGIARTFQIVRLFRRLSVLDNVMPQHDPNGRRTALEALEAIGLRGRHDVMAGDLTYFEQRRLELARALAERPRLLLVDEPTSGLSRAEAEEIVALLKKSFDPATTIVMVEHNLNAIEALCARSVLLVEGRVAADAATHDLLRDPQLTSVYFGTQTDTNRDR